MCILLTQKDYINNIVYKQVNLDKMEKMAYLSEDEKTV